MHSISARALPAQPDLLPDSIPAHIRERLAAESVRTIEDWRALGRRRFQLWGVTRAMCRQIDSSVAAKVRS